MSDEQPVWAWQCEHCHTWRHSEEQPTAVMVKEPGPDISAYSHVERLYLDRKMAICSTCVIEMRVRPR
jgi:hypothetical protein